MSALNALMVAVEAAERQRDQARCVGGWADQSGSAGEYVKGIQR